MKCNNQAFKEIIKKITKIQSKELEAHVKSCRKSLYLSNLGFLVPKPVVKFSGAVKLLSLAVVNT